MVERASARFPRWLFAILAVGGLVASGLYIGMMRVEGSSTGGIVRVAAYGIFGLLMMWGAVGRRHR